MVRLLKKWRMVSKNGFWEYAEDDEAGTENAKRDG